MKFSTLLTATVVSTGIVLGAVAAPAFAQGKSDKNKDKDNGPKNDSAVVLGQCVDAIAAGMGANGCLGQLSGNDDGNGLANTLATLASEWGGTWQKADKWDTDLGRNDNGILNVSYTNSTTGTFDFSGITGPFALAVKAAPGYNLFYFEDATSFDRDWTTEGLINNGGQTPGLSHLTLYTQGGGFNPEPVPEPLTIMGSAVALGFGGYFQKKRNAKKKSAK